MSVGGGNNNLDLNTVSIAPTSQTTENGSDAFGGPITTGAEYNYTIDFTVSTTFTLTGQFGFSADTLDTLQLGSGGVQGSFTIDDPALGTFTYTVQLSDLFGASLSAFQDVTGFGDLGSVDTDRFNFTYILCFAEGTGIAAEKGEVAIEALQVGDLIRTADGRDVPVRWLGRMSVAPMFNPSARLAPVLIRKGALGDTPDRDLIVTADHGMILDGRVINAGALVGLPGIEWQDWKAMGETVTYYHVETANHDVILANGAEAETYIDYVGRQAFDNYGEYLALYGEDQTITEMPLPRITTPRQLPRDLIARLTRTFPKAS